MVFLRIKGLNLLLFTDENILVYNCKDKSQRIVKIPDPEPQPNVSRLHKPENKRIISVCISKDASGYVAMALSNKQLVVYDNAFKVVKNVTTKRALSKIRFFHDHDVVVAADKTGDVLLYDLKTESEPRLLLGHLSMLLDVAVSECGKYIITCDRDEKIRISKYPNAYNIVNYCLGHQEFVTNLEVIGDLLVSASGDGTVRFWAFETGKELARIDTNDYLKDRSVINRFREDMGDENIEISAVPVTDMNVVCDTNAFTYVAVSLLGVNEIQVHRVQHSGPLHPEHVQTITLTSNLVCFNLNRGSLLVLTEKDLLEYNLVDSAYMEDRSGALGLFHEANKAAVTGTDDALSLLSLYKRKFDNVGQYLMRKKARVDSKP